MTYPANHLSLVADVGGTNTRVALADGTQVLKDTVRRYANDDHDSLSDVLRRYIAEEDEVDCKAACVAMAGPVRDGVAHLTNRGWSMDKETLAEIARAERTAILNDLQAQGHALGHLPQTGTELILPSEHPAGDQAAKLVIGIGTGFNIAPVYMTEPQRLVTPSEAGHALLPLRSARDLQLAEMLAQDHGVAAVEDVLSGRGLEALYRFCAHEAGAPATRASREIVDAFRDGTDPLARQAAEGFARFMGLVAGNLALNHLPFGGIYFAGGMARAFAPHLHELGFEAAFRDKGRFSDFMGQFAIHMIADDYAALTGCAAHLDGLATAPRG